MEHGLDSGKSALLHRRPKIAFASQFNLLSGFPSLASSFPNLSSLGLKKGVHILVSAAFAETRPTAISSVLYSSVYRASWSEWLEAHKWQWARVVARHSTI